MADNNHNTASGNQADKRLIGLLAQFEDPDSLVEACNQAREFGYKKMDAYSPFPVHGIDQAIGIRRTRLPFFVLAIGLSALFVGLGLQYYANAADFSPIFPGYRFKIGGKPYFSLPANIPVTFEIIVLSSAFASFLGMWAINRLPRLANPLFRISRFKRATNDKFFLMIDTEDKKFDRRETESKLDAWGASAIEEVNQDLTDQQLPNWIQLVGITAAFLLLLPPVLIFRAAGMTNRAPRMHIIPDMDWQDKNKTQTESPIVDGRFLFDHERVMREPIPGTVARGQLQFDSQYFQGIQPGTTAVTATVTGNVRTSLQNQDPQDAAKGAVKPPADAPPEPNWVTTFPEQVAVNLDLLKRGQQRFEIYCTPCHGYSGNGDGLVNQRALSLAATGNAAWTTAKSLHDPEVKKNPVGRIFDTISNGRNSMGPYKDQIPVEDRWAIVAYVKALQATGIQPPVTTTTAQADDQTKKPGKP